MENSTAWTRADVGRKFFGEGLKRPEGNICERSECQKFDAIYSLLFILRSHV